jgi:benzylsuccinate CoA-transferase BbsF subunit
MGDPEWAAVASLATTAGRLARRDEIGAKLADFTRRDEPRALMDLLQASGVPAGMVQRSSDHMEDPQLAHRGFFRRMMHPEMGEVPYEGHQFRIKGYDNGPRTPAPCPAGTRRRAPDLPATATNLARLAVGPARLA